MRNILPLLLALGLAGCADMSSAPPQAADIVLPTIFKDGVIFVKASVNGAPPVWMLLDNGTTPSAVDLAYARNLGLALKAGAGSGTGIGAGKYQFYNTSADVTAGEAAAHIDLSAIDLSAVPGPDGAPVKGVLGYSFLKGRIAVIDYPGSAVRFAALSAPCACDLAMTLDTDIPAVPVTVGGHPMQALVDTGGAYDVLLTPAAVQAAGLESYARAARPATGSGFAGAQTVAVGDAPEVTVDGITKTHPQALYAGFGTSPLKSPAALGFAFLKDYKVTLNYRARTVRFEP